MYDFSGGVSFDTANILTLRYNVISDNSQYACNNYNNSTIKITSRIPLQLYRYSVNAVRVFVKYSKHVAKFLWVCAVVLFFFQIGVPWHFREKSVKHLNGSRRIIYDIWLRSLRRNVLRSCGVLDSNGFLESS